MREFYGREKTNAESCVRELSRVNPEAFIQEMENEHRTHQQGFTRLCMAWLLNLKDRKSFDARNEASVMLAQKLLEGMDKYDIYLPYI